MVWSNSKKNLKSVFQNVKNNRVWFEKSMHLHFESFYIDIFQVGYFLFKDLKTDFVRLQFLLDQTPSVVSSSSLSSGSKMSFLRLHSHPYVLYLRRSHIPICVDNLTSSRPKIFLRLLLLLCVREQGIWRCHVQDFLAAGS